MSNMQNKSIFRRVQVLFAAVVLLGCLMVVSRNVAALTCPDGSYVPDAEAHLCPSAEGNTSDDAIETDCEASGSESLNKDNCKIIDYLVILINTLSALSGIVIVGSIIMGGIQYSSAGSDPQKVSAAKGRIRNAIFALLLFLFGFAFLNYLIPGGLL